MHPFRNRAANLRIGLPSPASEASSVPSPVHSPIDLNTPVSPNLDQASSTFASAVFGRWSNKSNPSIVQSVPVTPAKPSPYQSSRAYEERFITYDHPLVIKPAVSPRKPRHVPIIITEYASPYDPPQQIQTPVLGHPASLSEVAPTVAGANLADATELDTKPSQNRAKETSLKEVNSLPIMNNSQLSFTASESGTESAASSMHQSQSHTNLAAAAAAVVPSPNTQHASSAANVSGLVCNLHRTTGQEPHPLVGATTTILGDKLYVFGGRVHSKTKAHLSHSLYELDLVKRHWQKLSPAGDIPPPRYFHSACALGDTKLVFYGGMSPATHQKSPTPNGDSDTQPEVVVMNDIHIYDVPTNKWTKVRPSGTEEPQGRYAHCATILPSSATFTSADSHTSAIQHNPPSQNPHSGKIGVQIDGSGGAEMVVVGGQDSNNSYIQQISVFNLRNLRWTSNTPYDRNCGAYKSMVTALPGINAQNIGRGLPLHDTATQQAETSMLIYSNYNFLDVKLELQIRTPTGELEERPVNGTVSPPGLRFPNGGIINGHFVVSGTYLTSSKHEYALWALDLRTLTWAVIDTAGTVFGQGSWNRGVLWNRRNSYVILGHRKRNLVDDYNHRRINFSHLCLVELEAYGLYDNPRRQYPTSAYVSTSAPMVSASLEQNIASRNAGGRPISAIAEQLGHTALYVNEMSDMDIIAYNGEHIACNSRVLSQRWGPFFNQLMTESSLAQDTGPGSETTTLRLGVASRASRASALTITPSTNGVTPTASIDERSQSRSTQRTLVEGPNTNTLSASSRARVLYLPHMASTIRLLLRFLYTSSLPQINDPLCSVHVLCSLLQLARPYQIDGLQEAIIERLHEVLDGRNAAAVFNAAAMAAGGGRAPGLGGYGTFAALDRRESVATTVVPANSNSNSYGVKRGHTRSGSAESTSTATSATTDTTFSHTDTDSPVTDTEGTGSKSATRHVWTGDVSSVIGLQKRGLRGLMEGRRLRERANTADG